MLDRAQLERLYERSRGADWGLSRDAFAAALQASLARAFAGLQPMAREIDEHLESLQLEDLALAAACAAGSDPAWEHFVREFRPVLYRAADAIDPAGGARELADSLYADLYGLRGRSPGRGTSLFHYFHGRSRLATWLRAVLAQRHVDHLRGARRLDPLPDNPEALPAPSPAREADGADHGVCIAAMRDALAKAIAGLDARDRLRLSLYYAEQQTLAAIGRLLKEHEATVSRQLARARAEVRRAIEARLRADHGMDEAGVAACIRSVIEDPGPLNLADWLGAPAGARKNSAAGRSRE